MLTLALSKGRILNEALPLLARGGIFPVCSPATSRKLELPTNRPDLKLVVLRAQDVPTFVEHGAADLGIAGKDVLLEHGGGGIYEPMDLGIARCRLVLAARDGKTLEGARPRVATKYVKTTRTFFAQKGLQAEVIKLYGSMELAPLVGLAEYIVDVVDTGSTLRANGLVELEAICEISARLVVNKGAMKMKHRPIRRLMAEIGDDRAPPAQDSEANEGG